MSDLFASRARTFRLMRAKFLADANFDLVILVATKRRALAFEYQTALEAGLTGLQDPDVLAIAAREGCVLLLVLRCSLSLQGNHAPSG